MTEAKKYNEATTLIIGLGGIGSKISEFLYGKLKDNKNVTTFCIDSDHALLNTIKIQEKNRIFLGSLTETVRSLIERNEETKWWIRNNPIINQKTTGEGSGQVRFIGRLIFEDALNKKLFNPFYERLREIAEACAENNENLRISIITSTCGGTGSGIFIQIAEMIRYYMSENFPSVSLSIDGELILPEALKFLFTQSEKTYIETNTYAVFKELNAINENIWHNDEPILLVHSNDFNGTVLSKCPYDRCFLYNSSNAEDVFDYAVIIRAIYERLFGDYANLIHEEYQKRCKIIKTEATLDIYATFEIREESSRYVWPKLYHRAVQEAENDNCICFSDFVDSAKNKSSNILYIPAENKQGATLIKYKFQLDIESFPEFEYEAGKYYISYDKYRNRENDFTLTFHLDHSWRSAMPDIKSKKMTKCLTKEETEVVIDAKRLFISYSTKNQSFADSFRELLRKNGIDTWMAPYDIPVGAKYAQVINKAIKSCNCFVLLLSKASQESIWVSKELERAINYKKIIFPVQIEDVVLNDEFELFISTEQLIFIQKIDEDATNIKKLLTSIKACINP